MIAQIALERIDDVLRLMQWWLAMHIAQIIQRPLAKGLERETGGQIGFHPVYSKNGRCANHRQKSRHVLAHPAWRPLRRGLGLLPQPPYVIDEWPGQPELPSEQGHPCWPAAPR